MLSKAKVGHTGRIKAVSGSDKICKFLFSLGCSEGEEITLISILAGNYIISVKDSRYAIDKKMANSIELV
ncbi:FeoA family protein [Petroclostridium sp. X23]|uniref:FeoA family protein n=1 Tax=Petroclostridium sp. X23 TaxID=3045146 RepID=UPI0024ADF366|nr:FeoA family protein [Petroclostridium sp. X23]WHH61782.1 FeoA family protein [Petroclostridium sp. X23]